MNVVYLLLERAAFSSKPRRHCEAVVLSFCVRACLRNWWQFCVCQSFSLFGVTPYRSKKILAGKTEGER